MTSHGCDWCSHDGSSDDEGSQNDQPEPQPAAAAAALPNGAARPDARAASPAADPSLDDEVRIAMRARASASLAQSQWPCTAHTL